MSYASICTKTGCALFGDCLECPFPECLADRLDATLLTVRRIEARERYNQGMPVPQIARAMGLSRRQVRRYLDTELLTTKTFYT